MSKDIIFHCLSVSFKRLFKVFGNVLKEVNSFFDILSLIYSLKNVSAYLKSHWLEFHLLQNMKSKLLLAYLLL